ncbi:hypothetical protein [Dolichospermum compactum]|uniref:Uncharacterized protein n=1 Tax=Dolichospermum compactum NIES-806 TaxID=1973481 RepID=A0A1Z4UZE6_9CYAN|nr:hypothetical protein [Dolichospermum compactum]BAZ84637.1 hypothetical protein NIES806_08280 [Dolichospermum compactum NIES-806]
MSNQNIKSNLLVELSAEEQQLLSGGCCQSPPSSCRKPKKCGGDYDEPTPYSREDSYPDDNGNCDD